MKYSLSYTAASLRIHDTLLVAQAMSDNNYEGIDQIIGNGKTATGNRIRKELVKRLKNLTKEQFNFLLNSGLDDARKMSFVAICKTYDYIHEFVVEVLREKMLQFDYIVSDGEYFTFYNRKCELHSELEQLSGSSTYKIKQVLFRILEEAKIIDSVQNKTLQPQFLSKEFQKLLREDNPQLLRIFLMSETDINKI